MAQIAFSFTRNKKPYLVRISDHNYYEIYDGEKVEALKAKERWKVVFKRIGKEFRKTDYTKAALLFRHEIEGRNISGFVSNSTIPYLKRRARNFLKTFLVKK